MRKKNIIMLKQNISLEIYVKEMLKIIYVFIQVIAVGMKL